MDQMLGIELTNAQHREDDDIANLLNGEDLNMRQAYERIKVEMKALIEES